MSMISSGAMTITSQAPDRNLVLAMITAMTAVVAAPRPLMTRPRRQPGSCRRHHRTTMPDCESVNATNTPRVEPSKAMKLRISAPVRVSNTLTCAAPSPVPVMTSGVPSRLTSATATRTAPTKPGYGVIKDRTVWTSFGSGRTRIWLARKLIPRKRLPKMITCVIRVARAFFHSGFLNAGTPSDTASTPVKPAAPELKARSTRKSDRPPTPAAAVSQCSRHAAGAWKTARL